MKLTRNYLKLILEISQNQKDFCGEQNHHQFGSRGYIFIIYFILVKAGLINTASFEQATRQEAELNPSTALLILLSLSFSELVIETSFL